MRSMHQQQATCGLQICQHPMCWETNRQAIKGLLDVQNESLHGDRKAENSRHRNRVTPKDLDSLSSKDDEDDDDDDELMGLPTLTIFNMIDDYGINTADFNLFGADGINVTSRDATRRKSSHRRGKTTQVPKLALKAVASMSVDDVTAPANTPLHSSHGFGDQRDLLSDTSQPEYKPQKTAFSEKIKKETKMRTVNKLQLKIGDSNAVGLAPKRVMLWCPTSSRRKQLKNVGGISASKVNSVNLPLHSVPEYKQTTHSHKAIKGMVCKRNRSTYTTVKRLQAVRDAVSVTQPGQASRITPQEIEMLRRVPLDVLIKVLNQAEENGIISRAQSKFLLEQVGKKQQLPPIMEKDTSKDAPPSSPKEEPEPPKQTITAKPVNVLDVTKTRLKDERIATADPGFRLDSSIVRPTDLSQRRTAPPSTRALNDLNEDSQYDKKLRSMADENMRNFQSFMNSARKKTPVKYVATLFDENSSQCLVKPFHYRKSNRDLYLGPIPSPPPPTPPTERDSSYDPQIGGSTVMVNPSMTIPTLGSYEDQRISSAGGSKSPVSESEYDDRYAKITQTSLQGSRLNNRLTSPFGSISGHDGWPQINEEDYLRTAESSDVMSTPIPPFTEDDMRTLSRNESIEPIPEEPQVAEKFPIRADILSPAPPPPSPEPLSHGLKRLRKNSTPESPRIMGAATALGLVTLPKKSSLQTTPETEAGITPTPVVSSVKSDAETPSGGANTTQTVDNTPIPETPFENEQNDESVLVKPTPTDTDKIATVNEQDFENNVSPDVAIAELKEEAEKLEIQE